MRHYIEEDFVRELESLGIDVLDIYPDAIMRKKHNASNSEQSEQRKIEEIFSTKEKKAAHNTDKRDKKTAGLYKTIHCGEDTFSVSTTTTAAIQKATNDDLLEFEQKQNGNYPSPCEFFSPPLFNSFEKLLKEFTYEIGNRLPEPVLNHSDLQEYRSDYKSLEKMSNWKVRRTTSLTMLSSFFDDCGNAEILWKFIIYKEVPRLEEVSSSRIVKLREILPVLKNLIALPQSSWKEFWNSYSYKKIQKELPLVYDEYMRSEKKFSLRREKRRQFLESFGDNSILYITTNENEPPKKYLEGFCNFDIFEKEAEIKKIQEKLKSSCNEGEKDVEYALKWVLSSNNQYVVPIKADCESRYRYDCILLCKPDFMNELQEYDHILVTPAGIVLIETKHWRGNVEIRPDGKWLRKPDAESPAVGIESPKLQMRRHELVMQEILPGVPIHSILCFSNSSVIIDGRENFSDYPVITIDQLEDTLSSLCSAARYSKEEIDQMVETINAHKINVSV